MPACRDKLIRGSAELSAATDNSAPRRATQSVPETFESTWKRRVALQTEKCCHVFCSRPTSHLFCHAAFLYVLALLLCCCVCVKNGSTYGPRGHGYRFWGHGQQMQFYHVSHVDLQHAKKNKICSTTSSRAFISRGVCIQSNLAVVGMAPLPFWGLSEVHVSVSCDCVCRTERITQKN